MQQLEGGIKCPITDVYVRVAEAIFATVISSDTELQKEKCPSCGERRLKISGKLSHSELATQFSGGGG